MNDFASIKRDAERFTNTYATDMILIKLAQKTGECPFDILSAFDVVRNECFHRGRFSSGYQTDIRQFFAELVGKIRNPLRCLRIEWGVRDLRSENSLDVRSDGFDLFFGNLTEPKRFSFSVGRCECDSLRSGFVVGNACHWFAFLIR